MPPLLVGKLGLNPAPTALLVLVRRLHEEAVPRPDRHQLQAAPGPEGGPARGGEGGGQPDRVHLQRRVQLLRGLRLRRRRPPVGRVAVHRPDVPGAGPVLARPGPALPGRGRAEEGEGDLGQGGLGPVGAGVSPAALSDCFLTREIFFFLMMHLKTKNASVLDLIFCLSRPSACGKKRQKKTFPNLFCKNKKR